MAREDLKPREKRQQQSTHGDSHFGEQGGENKGRKSPFALSIVECDRHTFHDRPSYRRGYRRGYRLSAIGPQCDRPLTEPSAPLAPLACSLISSKYSMVKTQNAMTTTVNTTRSGLASLIASRIQLPSARWSRLELVLGRHMHIKINCGLGVRHRHRCRCFRYRSDQRIW
jgi:hypothetical protein